MFWGAGGGVGVGFGALRELRRCVGLPPNYQSPPQNLFWGGTRWRFGVFDVGPQHPRGSPQASELLREAGGGVLGENPSPVGPHVGFFGVLPPPQHPTGLGVPPGGRRTGPPSPPDLGEAPGSFLTRPQIQGKAAARRIRGGGGPHLPSLTLTMFLPLMMVFWVFFFFGGAYSWTSSTWVRSR